MRQTTTTGVEDTDNQMSLKDHQIRDNFTIDIKGIKCQRSLDAIMTQSMIL